VLWLDVFLRCVLWLPTRRSYLGIDAIRRSNGCGFGGITARAVWGCRQRMRFEPQRAGRAGRINPGALPPFGFIAAAVKLAMVPAT